MPYAKLCHHVLHHWWLRATSAFFFFFWLGLFCYLLTFYVCPFFFPPGTSEWSYGGYLYERKGWDTCWAWPYRSSFEFNKSHMDNKTNHCFPFWGCADFDVSSEISHLSTSKITLGASYWCHNDVWLESSLVTDFVFMMLTLSSTTLMWRYSFMMLGLLETSYIWSNFFTSGRHSESSRCFLSL